VLAISSSWLYYPWRGQTPPLPSVAVPTRSGSEAICQSFSRSPSGRGDGTWKLVPSTPPARSQAAPPPPPNGTPRQLHRTRLRPSLLATFPAVSLDTRTLPLRNFELAVRSSIHGGSFGMQWFNSQMSHDQPRIGHPTWPSGKPSTACLIGQIPRIPYSTDTCPHGCGAFHKIHNQVIRGRLWTVQPQSGDNDAPGSFCSSAN
jgi:hypothetical protein